MKVYISQETLCIKPPGFGTRVVHLKSRDGSGFELWRFVPGFDALSQVNLQVHVTNVCTVKVEDEDIL